MSWRQACQEFILVLCKLSASPLKCLSEHTKTGERACMVPLGNASCLGKCQKDQPDAETSVSLIHSLKTPYGVSPLVARVRNN